MQSNFALFSFLLATALSPQLLFDRGSTFYASGLAAQSLLLFVATPAQINCWIFVMIEISPVAGSLGKGLNDFNGCLHVNQMRAKPNLSFNWSHLAVDNPNFVWMNHHSRWTTVLLNSIKISVNACDYDGIRNMRRFISRMNHLKCIFCEVRFLWIHLNRFAPSLSLTLHCDDRSECVQFNEVCNDCT